MKFGACSAGSVNFENCIKPCGKSIQMWVCTLWLTLFLNTEVGGGNANISLCMLRLVALSAFIQKHVVFCLFRILSPQGTATKIRRRFSRDVFNTLSSRAGLVYVVAGTDCWGHKTSSTQGYVLGTYPTSVFNKRDKKLREKLLCVRLIFFFKFHSCW